MVPPTVPLNRQSAVRQSVPFTSSARWSWQCPGVAMTRISRSPEVTVSPSSIVPVTPSTPASSGCASTGTPKRRPSSPTRTTWSGCAWVTSTCVIEMSRRSISSSSGSSTPFESTSTPWPPSWSATRYAFESQDGCSAREMIIGRDSSADVDLVEVDDRADAVLLLHQLEAAVHLVERQLVGEQRWHVDVAGQPAVDEQRHLRAALDPAERRAGDAAAGDEQARHDVERLTLAGDADHGGEAPRLAGRLDRLLHDADEAGRLERVVGAETAGLGLDLVDDVVTGRHRVGGAVVLRH